MKYIVTITTVDGSTRDSRPLTAAELDENSEGILANLDSGRGAISLTNEGLGTIIRAEHIVALAITEVPE